MEAAFPISSKEPQTGVDALLGDPGGKDEIAARLAAIHPLVDVGRSRSTFLAFAQELEEALTSGGVEEAARLATQRQLAGDERSKNERARASLINKFVIDAYLHAKQQTEERGEKQNGRMRIGAPTYAHPLDVSIAVRELSLPPMELEQARTVGALHDIKEDTDHRPADIVGLAVTQFPFPVRRQNREYPITIEHSVSRLTRGGFFYVSEYMGLVWKHHANETLSFDDRLICGEVKSTDRAQLNPLISAFPGFRKRFKECIKSYWIGAVVMKPLLSAVGQDSPLRQSVERATYRNLFSLLATLDEFIAEKERKLEAREDEEKIDDIWKSVRAYVAGGNLRQISQPAERTFFRRDYRKNDGTIIGGFLLLFPEREELEKRISEQYKDRNMNRNEIYKELLKGDMRFMTSDAYRGGRRSSKEEFERLMKYRDDFIAANDGNPARELRRYLLLRNVVALEILDPTYKILPTGERH